MTIKALRILPPFAIGRLGSAAEPLDNYAIDDNPDQPLAFRRIVPAPTFRIDPVTGGIASVDTPETMEFKTDGKIRPVAPFLEVFAVTDTDELVPLTTALLAESGLDAGAIAWNVAVANRKIVRRTTSLDDLIHAETDWFADHAAQDLKGICRNFVSPALSVDFGQVRYIRPTADYPQIRLRFIPGKGHIYGTRGERQTGADTGAVVVPDDRAIYDRTKGTWFGYEGAAGADDGVFINETLPPSLYAIDPPAPSWLNDNKAVSRGYFDDACDGFVDVRLTLGDGTTLTASARICAAPPALVPDSLFVRSLADDLEQIVHGTKLADDTPEAELRARAQDIVRRAFETVRFMNVNVMNGNDFEGRPSLLLDSMPEEEAADTERSLRPVMGPETVDTFAIMTLHEQVYAALRGGAAPWFVRLIRQPDEVADFTDRGRRKMPALMCGADNNYLALTYRQIDTIARAAVLDAGAPMVPPPPAAAPPLTPRNATAQINYVAAGNPISSRPITSVANCCPGLEIDFRAVWRRLFTGVELREYDNLVIAVEADAPEAVQALLGHRLLAVRPVGGDPISMVTRIYGPASSDIDAKILLTTQANPAGVTQLEWSNTLAPLLETSQGARVRCYFTRDVSRDRQQDWFGPDDSETIAVDLVVRHFFDDDTAVIARALADAGELTQGLCSPWQNDYRECSCYYWASARPDYVNVEAGSDGLSRGDNWLQKDRTGRYVPDDYVDSRLILYDDLFENWEKWLRFQIGGRDAPGEQLVEDSI